MEIKSTGCPGYMQSAEAHEVILHADEGQIYDTPEFANYLESITITGQRALRMLIEMMEERGIQVVSANTDGVVCRRSHEKKL